MDINQVHDQLSQLIQKFADSSDFASELTEAATDEFAALFGKDSASFSFDSFFHTDVLSDWHWHELIMKDRFEGPFFLYLPNSWPQVSAHKTTANVFSDNKIRQSIFIMDKATWSKNLPEFMQTFQVEAFGYYPLLPPRYHQWLLCTRQDRHHWIYGIYSAQDWVFVVKSDAENVSDLTDHLISLLNTNPWHGWIEYAKQKSAAKHT